MGRILINEVTVSEVQLITLHTVWKLIHWYLEELKVLTFDSDVEGYAATDDK